MLDLVDLGNQTQRNMCLYSNKDKQKCKLIAYRGFALIARKLYVIREIFYRLTWRKYLHRKHTDIFSKEGFYSRIIVALHGSCICCFHLRLIAVSH